MQTLKSFLDQSLLIWRDSTPAARFGIALLLIMCGGAIVGVGIWSSRPHYVNLASDLDPGKASQLIDALEAADISYQLTGSGSIRVDKKQRARAKIAAGKLGIGQMESALEEVSPWMDPLNQQNTFRRNQERQLENSIQRYRFIESADVHLSIPEKQAFIRQSNAPSASVLLEITPGGQFGESQAASIASLVASAVEGLTTERVSITDTDGNEFATDESLGRLNKQEEFRVNRERLLARKAEMMLTKILGFGNASVAVSTDFTFPEGTLTTDKVDPEEKVITSEIVKNKTTTGENPIASGSAGTASNLGPNNGSIAGKIIVSKTEDLDSKFAVSKSTRIETINTPILNMMTVSVLVNSISVEDENQVVPPDIKKGVEALVRQAVGIRDGKDQITVEFFEFVEQLPIEVAPGIAIPWDQINQVLKNLSLGLAAIVALYIALKALRKINPDPATSQEKTDRSTHVNQLSELVKQNPEVFSKIIESWSKQDSSHEESQESKAA